MTTSNAMNSWHCIWYRLARYPVTSPLYAYVGSYTTPERGGQGNGINVYRVARRAGLAVAPARTPAPPRAPPRGPGALGAAPLQPPHNGRPPFPRRPPGRFLLRAVEGSRGLHPLAPRPRPPRGGGGRPRRRPP